MQASDESTSIILDPLADQEPIVIEKNLTTEKAARLAFNEELVTIRLQPPGMEPHPELAVDLSVNGRKITLVRGVAYSIPRKYLEVLERCRPHTAEPYQETTMGSDGGKDVTTKVRITQRLRYPYEVLKDTNQGREWLERLKRQPA